MTTATHPATPHQWPAAARVGYRFLFAYLVLFSFPGPFAYLPFAVTRAPSSWIYNATLALSRWTQIHLFGIPSPPPHSFTGSADTLYRYATYLDYLLIAAAAAVVWTLLDRRRPNYSRLDQWLRAWIRIDLATIIFGYGFAKVIPTQFAVPSLQSYAQPLGEFSPMGLLWVFMGSSTAYSVFSGIAEVLGGLCLLLRRTATLGGLILIAVMVNVTMLNFTYDVPVKIFSLHLLLMAAYIVAPDARRLLNVLVLNQATAPRLAMPLFTRRWARAVATAAVALFAGYIMWSDVSDGLASLSAARSAAAASPLYGIYDVEGIHRDDAAMTPVAAHPAQWRRVIFDAGSRITIRTGSDIVTRFNSKVDAGAHAVTLTDRAVPGHTLVLTFEQPEENSLVLRGTIAGEPSVLRLRRFDEKQYLLLNRGFNWIQERPFNR
ncbi:MAG TPA: hypothetical protein VMZ90_07720 [Vicinamibacterales bacterium]|nr:hypothetical protein [Vicinamibacterales bacterium]